MKKVKLGIIGLGGRGTCMLENPIMSMKKDDVDVIAVCDLLQDRADYAAKLVAGSGNARPFVTTNYRALLAIKELDAVYIATSWESHMELAIAAMKAGKYVGMEVGGAYSVEDCYKLIHTYEETGTECMLMENCCYGERELMVLNMVRQGIFGDIMHCNGAYNHDLRHEIIDGKEMKHYRLRNYLYHDCENYPTHEIGPIAKVLGINNGNRFTSLSSFSSSAKGLHQYVIATKGKDHPLAKADFAQGDIVTTMLTCAGGQTVCITLGTSLPRAYSRRFEVHGTKGMYMEDNDSIFLDSNKQHHLHDMDWKSMWGNAQKYVAKYSHPLWKSNNQVGDMHGGMDTLVFAAFVEAVRKGIHPPIDVYDAATYMCISALSRESIALGGTPVAFPDFTSGKWHMRTDIVENSYTLDKIGFGKDLAYVD